MVPQFWWQPSAAALLLILAGCASHYDSQLIERRTQQLYGERSAPPMPTPKVEGVESTHEPEAHLLEQATLEEYLAFGLRHNAELRAAFETWRAQTERVQQVSTLPDPKLSFGEFLEEVQTRTGPQRRRIGISQAFPWPGELDAKAKLEKHEAEVAWAHVEQVRLSVSRRIEEAFYEYAYLARELAITEELLTLVRGLEPIVQGRIRAGSGQEDLLRLQVEIGRLEDNHLSVQRRRRALSARLADEMNMPQSIGSLLPLPQIDVPETKAISWEGLVERALRRNPALHGLQFRVQAAQASEELAGFRRKPSFALQIDRIDTGEALSPSTLGSGDDPLFVGLSLNLPVWTSSYAAADREVRHRIIASRAKLEDAQSKLSADIAEQVYRVEDSQRRIRLYQESLLPRSREALQLTTVAYRSGGATVLDLLDSERALLEFELSLWRASREYLQGEARLTELLGGKAQ